jgi:predicted amidophosphoribosyltransferase
MPPIVKRVRCKDCNRSFDPTKHSQCPEGGGTIVKVGDTWQCQECGTEVNDSSPRCKNCGGKNTTWVEYQG